MTCKRHAPFGRPASGSRGVAAWRQVARGMLGLTLLAVLLAHGAFAGPLGFSVGATATGEGVEITRVTPGSKAQQAGLEAGDRIISFNHKSVNRVEAFVASVRLLSEGESLRLLVDRKGWQRTIDLSASPTPDIDQGGKAIAHRNQPVIDSKPPHVIPPARADGLRTTAKVGHFSVKAAKASSVVGDGLRELMVSALYRSGYFFVVEPNNAQLPARKTRFIQSHRQSGQTQVADILVYGIVSEFEPEAGGYGYSNFIPQAGLIVRQSSKYAEMAIDVRAVDVKTGRVLVAQRIPGSAQSFSGGLGGGIGLPIGLAAYRDTPMEFAIRDCIEKAALFVANNIPENYFSH